MLDNRKSTFRTSVGFASRAADLGLISDPFLVWGFPVGFTLLKDKSREIWITIFLAKIWVLKSDIFLLNMHSYKNMRAQLPEDESSIIISRWQLERIIT